MYRAWEAAFTGRLSRFFLVVLCREHGFQIGCCDAHIALGQLFWCAAEHETATFAASMSMSQ